MIVHLITISFLLVFCSTKDTFKENLIISNFQDAISFHFDFQTTTSDLTSNDYHLFPKSINEIIRQYSVSEMHLSLAKGFWNTEKWGISPVSMPSESAELWAWFEPTEKEIQWNHLSHALSGLFCTSLNKLSNEKEVISPKFSFNPEGLTNRIRNDTLVRRSVLSGEAVCTENLTPWIKLLPCKKLAGLAQLLKPSRLFSSHFTSITVGVRKICLTDDCTTIGRLIHQTITLVLDRKIFGNFHNTWSLHELLNTESKIEICSLAETSRVFVHGFGPSFNLKLKPTEILDKNNLVYYDLKTFKKISNKIDLQLSGHWPVEDIMSLSKNCPIQFTKFATGTGKVRGGIKATIKSQSDKMIRVVYLESLPWYFHFLFSSLVLKINSNVTNPQKIHYIPSLMRGRMTHLELVIDVPAFSTVTVEYEFRKLLQNWNEFPPDANHEFYIGASSLSFRYPTSSNKFQYSLFDILKLTKILGSFNEGESKIIRLYSEVVLVTLPTPDFSMPFNALCLACTVLAIMIGGLHKYTTSSVHGVDPKLEGLKGKIILGIRFIQKLCKRDKIQDNIHATKEERENKPHEE